MLVKHPLVKKFMRVICWKEAYFPIRLPCSCQVLLGFFRLGLFSSSFFYACGLHNSITLRSHLEILSMISVSFTTFKLFHTLVSTHWDLISVQRMLPAPVAPEQGTAASTTETERSDSSRNCRAIVRPIIPAPTTTTSNVWDDAFIGFKPRKEQSHSIGFSGYSRLKLPMIYREICRQTSLNSKRNNATTDSEEMRRSRSWWGKALEWHLKQLQPF